MSARVKICIVEDDATIRTLLEMALLGAGYSEVTSFSRGDDGWEGILYNAPDLVLLDVMLPGLDGFEIARRVRATPALAATRILMLTARTESDDVVNGLEAGADDYIAKPFDRKVLLARIKAVMRRGLLLVEGVDFDGLTLNEANRTAMLKGKMIELTAGEFELLVKLVSRRGRIVARAADARSVDVQIAKLRQKLGPWGNRIETIRGVGYRLSVGDNGG